MHLDAGEDRHVVGLGRREQHAGLALGEHLSWACLDTAVNAQPSALSAPPLRPGLGIGQVHELLTGEEVPANILDTALDSGLVLGVPNPGGVGGKPAVLGIIQPTGGEARVHHRLASATIGDMLSGINTQNTPPKNRHAASHPAMTADSVGEKVNHTNMCRE